MTARSWLFVPGDSPEKIKKSVSLDADTLIIDLEDAVAENQKALARNYVAKWLSERHLQGDVWIRVNNSPGLLEEDLKAVLVDGVAGIILPKTHDESQVQRVGDLISEAAPRANIGLIPMIETAFAVMNATQIARADRVKTLMVGSYDLAAELGIQLSPSHVELRTARALVVLACSAAGVESPIGPVSIQFRDESEFSQSTLSLRAEGHFGRAVIHPAQIGPANAVFTPSASEVSKAELHMKSFEMGLASGRGVAVDDDGTLIDEATVRLAARTLETARRTREKSH